MNRTRFLLALAFAALVVAAVAGCSRNRPGTLLAPTGYRPAPALWSGRVVGMLFFDPVNTPDLSTAPYPPTRVELWRYQPDTVLVAVDSLPSDSRWFEFPGLSPSADYRVIVSSTVFYNAAAYGIHVNESTVDAGNITLHVNPAATASGMEIIGTMSGFRIADLVEYMFPIDVTELYSSALGVWDYPNLDYEALPITAGTYHFKFATLFPTVVTNITGWGNPSGGTLTAPVTDHRAVFGSGNATDIVMTFPTTGVYKFRLDERRQTFSVSFDHAVPALAASALGR